jgi:hypothetical protein
MKLCAMKIGGEGQTSLFSRGKWSRNQIRREKESGSQSVIGSEEDAGTAAAVWKKGTLDRSETGRVRERCSTLGNLFLGKTRTHS